tara:strand:- start:16405 stop:17001 length:597 start_codon:yes stop_codon:yes gene_type:complete
MKITTQLVIQRFLSILLEQLQTKKESSLDEYFEDFFTIDEMIALLKSQCGFDENINVNRLSKKDLISKLSNEGILSYYLNAWKKEIARSMSITPFEVYRTLDQLGLHTHYLMSKPIPQWDEYDYSNYNALRGKAGRVTTVYGLYDSDVTYKDVDSVTSQPKRFYETYELAQAQLIHLFSESLCAKDELHVLPKLIGNA